MGWFHVLSTLTLFFSLVSTPSMSVYLRIAVQQPTLPASFYGTVLINGENVPTNTTIQAVIKGQAVSSCQALVYEGITVYTMDVPGDAPGTNHIDGGKTGDTITFLVNGFEANETAIWHSGTNKELNLTVQITATPEPTPTQTTPTLAPLNPTPTRSSQDVTLLPPTSTGTRPAPPEITTALPFTPEVGLAAETSIPNTNESFSGIQEPVYKNSELDSVGTSILSLSWFLAAGVFAFTLTGLFWILFRKRNHG